MPRLLPSTTALQCFETAARLLSMTQAASELHLTQSAVSKQVAGLEALLGRPLFTRNHQRLQLTTTGERYLSEVKKILTYVDSSSRAIVAYGDTTSVLTVAAVPALCSRWLLPALKGFGQQHPDIHLDLRDDLRGQESPGWQADVVFDYSDATVLQRNQLRLFGERLIAVCAPGFKQSQDLHSWLDTNVLLHCSNRPDAWRNWLSSQGVDSPRSHAGPRLAHFDMCVSAALAGCGVALVPDVLVQSELASQRLVQARPHTHRSPGYYYLTYANRVADTPKIRALTDWILASLKRDYPCPDIDADGATPGRTA